MLVLQCTSLTFQQSRRLDLRLTLELVSGRREKKKSRPRSGLQSYCPSRGRIQNCASIAKADFNTRVLCYQRRVCPDLLHKGHTGKGPRRSPRNS